MAETRSAERQREAEEKGLGGRRLQVAKTHSDERRREVVVDRLLPGACQVEAVKADAAKQQL